MNIKEYKNAYDGIHATKALKKRVMDAAEQTDEEPHRSRPPSGKRKMLLSILGAAGGLAAAFALIVLGGGFLRSLFAEDRTIVVTAAETPAPEDFSASSAQRELIAGLSSPKLHPSPDEYEKMPALGNGSLTRTLPFRKSFTAFDGTLTEAVGRNAFAEWTDHFSALPPYYTFYNNPNLLSYVVYFDISEEKAAALLSAAGGYTDEEIRAVSTRNEALCRRLFTADELPFLTYSEREGYLFYTAENLYEMSSDRLAELFRREGYSYSEPPEPMRLLLKWTDTLGDPLCAAAAERKSLLVSAALFEDGKPSLSEDSDLSAIYDPAVSDFGETLNFNGIEIYNYVRKLVKDSAPDDETYRRAVEGSVGEPNAGTIPSYRRLLSLKELNISEEMLGEALDMINRHYYGQTGNMLYPEEAITVILYGTDEEFEEWFVSPYTLRSENNPVGTLWLSGAEIYELSVSDWLNFSDLSEEYLYRLSEALNGMEKEFFLQKIQYYREIRLLTAEKLDGGAMAADEALCAMPALPETLQTALASESFGGLSGAGIYYAALTELAEMRISGAALLDEVRRLTDAYPELRNYEYKAPLLRKAYLYLWHTDDVNLYCDEYLETLDLFMEANADYSAKTDGKTVYVRYPGFADESVRTAVSDYLAARHLTRIAADAEFEEPADLTVTRHFAAGEPSLFLEANPNPILPNAAERGVWACAGYGYDKWLKRNHAGIDFAAASGDEIAALADGTVTYAGLENDYGLCVHIDHGNGLETLYAHCSQIYAEAGDSVRQGDIVAEAGFSGNATGAHLHFELRRDGTPSDPTPYLNGKAEIVPALAAPSYEQAAHTDGAPTA